MSALKERWLGLKEPLDPIPGRIPGSLNLPLTENLDSKQLFNLGANFEKCSPEAFERHPPRKLIVQCGSGVTACHTLLALESAGLSGASLYVGSYSEWCRSGREIGKGD